MTIAQHRSGSLVAGWGRFLLGCRVLLVALLIGGGGASVPTVAQPPTEYSRSLASGTPAAFGQIERVFSYGRGEIAAAAAAAPSDHGRATFAAARPVYEFKTSSLASRAAPHDYEAIGPPTTDISQPA
jgi:hypothetical protein